MKRRHPISVTAGAVGVTHTPGIAPWRRSAKVAGILLVTAAVIGLGADAWFRNQPRPPKIDLAQTSPSVRHTVERHLEELQKQPRSAWAWGRLGSVLYAYRLHDPALYSLAEAARRDPRNPRWPYLQAILLQYQDPARALDLLRRAVGLVGNDPTAPRLRLARWLAEQGRWAEARPEIEALLQVKPEPPHALLLAAQDAQARGDASQAAAWANRAAETPLAAKPALSLLSALLARQGDSAGASNAAHRARSAPGGDLLVDPFDAEALALREDPSALSEKVHPLMARGQLDAASGIVGRMIQDHPDHADTWLAAGRMEFLRRDLPKAENHLRRHLELDAASVQGWFQLGMVLLGRNQFSEAADAFARAVELKPDLAPAWHNRGLALGRLGRPDEAMAAFQNVLRYSPEHLDAYILYADLRLQRQEKSAALELLDQAARLNPADRRIAELRRKAAAL